MKNMEGNATLTILLAIFALSSFLLLFFFLEEKKENKRLTRRLDHYQSTYDSKQGWTSLYGNFDKGLSYNLKTFDGGKTWYACEYGDNWELKILGEAEQVYPGLMANLDAWDRITNYAAKNGPIDPTNVPSEMKETMDIAGLKTEKK